MRLHKIFYVPGMFSALILPLLLWYFGMKKLREPVPVVVDFGLPAKYNPKIPMDRVGTFEPMRNWNYKKIVVQPNSAKTNSSLYVAELRKLQKDNKKETGIEFVLNDKNSYGDFVSIINDFYIAKQEIFGLDLDKTGHVFAILDYKDPNKNGVEYFFGDDVIYTIDDGRFGGAFEKKYDYEDLLKDVMQIPKNIFYIIFGFLILLNFSVLDLVQKSKYH